MYFCHYFPEIHSIGGNISPGFHRSVHRQSSISASSDRISVASVLTTQAGDGNTLTPQQYGVMGKLCDLVLELRKNLLCNLNWDTRGLERKGF